MELKYKINDETFKISDYTYEDTINWVEGKKLIKIIKGKIMN